LLISACTPATAWSTLGGNAEKRRTQTSEPKLTASVPPTEEFLSGINRAGRRWMRFAGEDNVRSGFFYLAKGGTARLQRIWARCIGIEGPVNLTGSNSNPVRGAVTLLGWGI